MKKIGILSGGGDAPGLNAVIRAVVKTAQNEYGCEVFGIKDGFDGLLAPDGVIRLGNLEVRGILHRGGTILGTNRSNPYAYKVIKNGKEKIVDVSAKIIKAIKDKKFDALIVIGNQETLRFAHDLSSKGIPVIGIPKSIDNDIYGTEDSFGFDTALGIATKAIDRLHTTAESHQRVMIVEMMGMEAGFISLHAGVASGTDIILIPEIPFKLEAVVRKVLTRKEQGSLYSIIAISEGARPAEGEPELPGHGSISQKLGAYLEKATEIETRVTVLGYVQRGGTPSAYDRWLATRYGSFAVHVAAQGNFDRMVTLVKRVITDIPLLEAISMPKRVDIWGEDVLTARGVGIAFGNE